MKTITVAFTTSRHEPRLDWFFDSLALLNPEQSLRLIVVDSRAETRVNDAQHPSVKNHLIITPPKPNVWQGQHRLTTRDCWAVSNARNTAICLCETDYIVFLDDRCVLGEQWLEGVQHAAIGEYAVCGTYEKWHGMIVDRGVIKEQGRLDGKDARQTTRGVQICHHQFWGGTLGMPLKWALDVNGFEELVDGLGGEDYIMGMMLSNAGYVTKFDPRIKVIQDRTPGQTGPDMFKTSKERWPHDKDDKGHKAIERFGSQKRSQHPWNLAAIRERVLRGEQFPPAGEYPRLDWFDGKPIAEIV